MTLSRLLTILCDALIVLVLAAWGANWAWPAVTAGEWVGVLLIFLVVSCIWYVSKSN